MKDKNFTSHGVSSRALPGALKFEPIRDEADALKEADELNGVETQTDDVALRMQHYALTLSWG